MGLRGDRRAVASPVQHHRTLVANDLQLIDGTMDTLGNPHHYLNQDGMDFLTLRDAAVSPWIFTGLPQSRPSQIVLIRESVQFLCFRSEEAQEQFQPPIRTSSLILNLPLAIIKGNVPFLSEAQLGNFLDFWKGTFFPVVDARVYYLAPSGAELPSQVPQLYVNRKAILSYIQG
jgi:hypothetical protein